MDDSIVLLVNGHLVVLQNVLHGALYPEVHVNGIEKKNPRMASRYLLM